uniref:1,4-dihydroxy-6-naphtoate synthase n=1 Tax=mine drainage metagenome TaxID=410659 RepID=E6PFZ6_9ZZZZ
MNEPIELAYSPCPNDTYIFAALTNGLLAGAPPVNVVLLDIDELNESAARARYPLTKVSYGAIPYLMRDYYLLRSGGALGRGCGPLVVARRERVPTWESLDDPLVAIPGERTTAFLLLQLALGRRPRTRIMRFDRIVEAVASGEVDAGLIIHESRFTYQRSGLHELLDLGAWWERTTGQPIPLGAILARRDMSRERALAIDAAVRSSLAFARRDESTIMPYVREHAFEMDETVMRAHIDLYVNDYSVDVGDDGVAAVESLFSRGRNAGILPADAKATFVS